MAGYASARPFLGRIRWLLGVILMTVSAVSATELKSALCVAALECTVSSAAAFCLIVTSVLLMCPNSSSASPSLWTGAFNSYTLLDSSKYRRSVLLSDASKIRTPAPTG
ncbi:hypothetical protein C8R44DRAFT_869854 [Mycena epipterygia]|nr:hypothetical protein C8R44DRAFT_869854 [Mycena epipterygia]